MNAYTNAPTFSPWGKVQDIEVMHPGVFWVSTSSHGGILAKTDVALRLFSQAALRCSFQENGYVCFEEDCDAMVGMRELMDQGLWEPSWVSSKEAFEESLNKSIESMLPEYWEAYQAFRPDHEAKREVSPEGFARHITFERTEDGSEHSHLDLYVYDAHVEIVGWGSKETIAGMEAMSMDEMADTLSELLVEQHFVIVSDERSNKSNELDEDEWER